MTAAGIVLTVMAVTWWAAVAGVWWLARAARRDLDVPPELAADLTPRRGPTHDSHVHVAGPDDRPDPLFDGGDPDDWGWRCGQRYQDLRAERREP